MADMQTFADFDMLQIKHPLQAKLNIVVLPSPTFQLGMVTLNSDEMLSSGKKKTHARANTTGKSAAKFAKTNCTAISKGEI